MTVRTLIVDDHHVVREGLAMLLDAVDGIEVAGQAATGEDAVEQAMTLQPDVVLLDLDMPGAGGLAAIAQLRTISPGTRILILTMHADDAHLFRALRAGALGYLVKDSTPDEVVRAIQATADGQAIFAPTVAGRMIAYFTEPGTHGAPEFPGLTDRERDILTHIAAGRSNDAIASMLGLTTKTVRNHVSAVFAKLHVASRAEAIVRAREAGLGKTR
jgi:DNA-binding NarL/FixJ family response regulator